VAYPGSTTSLGQAVQDSDGPFVEPYTIPASAPYTHRLGIAAYGWGVAPTGGVAISPPGAPTAGAAVTDASFGLVSNGNYSWALTNVTQYGETTAGTSLHLAAIGVGTTGQTLNLPAMTQGTSDVPIVSRRLYRTTNGGAQLKLVADILDAQQTTYVDGRPDDALGPNAPGTNSSGLASSVALAGASTTWTEMPPGTAQAALTAGQYTVDYSLSGTTCGLITHATADAGKSPTATYRAATVVTSTVINALVTAQKDTELALGTTPQGSYADASARLVGHENDIAALYGTFPNANSGHAPTVVATPTVAAGSYGYRAALYDDRFLLVPCTGSTNVEVWDLVNPASPVRVATIALPTDPGPTNQNPPALCVVGKWLFIVSGSPSVGTVFLYDLTNPGVPATSTNLAMSNWGGDIVALGRYVVALAYDNPGQATYMIDTAQIPGLTTATYHTLFGSGTPGRLAAIPQHSFVAVSGNTSLAGVAIVRVPAGTALVSYTNAAFSTPNAIAHFGGEWLAVGNTGNSNLVIVNCTNWASPSVAATLTLAGTILGITPYGRYLLVNSNNGNLYVVNVAVPGTPVLAATIALGGAPTLPVPLGRYVLAGPTNGTTRWSVLDMSGEHLAGASIDGAEVGQLRVRQNASVANLLSAGAALIGAGGLSSSGTVVGAPLAVGRGSGLLVPGQGSNTSAGNTANQAAGTFKVPSGTNNANVTVPNTLVTATSIVLLTISGSPSTITNLTHNRGSDVAGTSFSVAVYTTGATAFDVDVHYLILN
jgi:hypothetical protein